MAHRNNQTGPSQMTHRTTNKVNITSMLHTLFIPPPSCTALKACWPDINAPLLICTESTAFTVVSPLTIHAEAVSFDGQQGG